MKFKLKSVKDAGDLARERVVLRAVERADIGSFLICQGTAAGVGGVSSHVGKIFWFPDLLCEPGDYVVLYTKSGMAEEPIKNKAGTRTFNVYWGLDQPIWHKPGVTPVLMSISAWEAL